MAKKKQRGFKMFYPGGPLVIPQSATPSYMAPATNLSQAPTPNIAQPMQGAQAPAIGLSNIAGGVQGAVGLYQTMADNLKVPKIQEKDFTSGSKEELLSKATDFKGYEMSKTNAVSSGLSGAASGAAAGTAIAPGIGTAIGGAVGAVGGAVSSIFGNSKRKRAKRRAERAAINNINAQNTELTEDSIYSSLSSQLADGGNLHYDTSRENRGKLTAQIDNTYIEKPRIKEPVEQSVNGVKWSDLDFKTQMMNRGNRVNGRPQEEGLEIVSPEFDMISGIRGLTNIKIPNLGNHKIINKLEPDNKKTIEYVANKNSSKTYIGLLERPNKNISLQESLGVPKQLRNLKIKNNPNSGINSNVHTNLINRNKSIYDFSTGDLIWKNKSNNNQIRATYHFTTDQPVLSHSFANWDDASETLIFPYKNAVRQAGNPISTEPMDTFFASPNNFKINRDGVRILTGNKKNYLKYKGWKVNAEYSKESDDILNALKDKKIKREDILQTIKSKNLNRKEIDDLNLEIKKLDNDIDDLMNKNRDIHSNWVNKNNQISLKDYDDIYAETNIPNSIKQKTEYSEKTIKNKELEYWTQPTTHSDSWLGTAESDIKAGINQFLKKAKKGEPIRKEELTMFQYYFNRLNNKTNFRLDNSSDDNKMINRILSGEKIFKYQSGGSFKSQVVKGQNGLKLIESVNNRSKANQDILKGVGKIAGIQRADILLNFSQQNTKALGGSLAHSGDFSNGVTLFENGGTHEENPLGGIPQGYNENGELNLVEQGETKWKDYIFSDRNKLSKAERFGLPGMLNNRTFSSAAKTIQKESEERPLDLISKRGLNKQMDYLMSAQEEHNAMLENTNQFKSGGQMKFKSKSAYNAWLAYGHATGAFKDAPGNQDVSINGSPKTVKHAYGDWLRYAPVASNVIGLASDIASTPETIQTARIEAPLLTEKMSYGPIDQEYLTNKLTSNYANLVDKIQGSSGGNRGVANASMIAAMNNLYDAYGDTAIKSREYNRDMLSKTLEFNRATSQANAQMRMAADQYNANAEDRMIATNAANRAARRNAIREQIAALGENLGAIGTEKRWMDLAPKLYGYSATGEYINKTKDSSIKDNNVLSLLEDSMSKIPARAWTKRNRKTKEVKNG